jgi:5-aminopentanamidase
MQIALVEVAARFGAPDETADMIVRATQDLSAELVVLPECALTGYVDRWGGCDLSGVAEPAVEPGDDLTSRTSPVGTLARHARSLRTTWVVPLVERDRLDRLFNSVVAIDPTGHCLARHRKRHPWLPEVWATPGEDPFAVVTIAGREALLAICFDVHFLEDEAADALSRAELLVFPSAWVDDGPRDLRGPIFDRLARRFDLVVANANWGPGVPRVRGQGRSRVVRPDGASEELRDAEGPVGLLVREL